MKRNGAKLSDIDIYFTYLTLCDNLLPQSYQYPLCDTHPISNFIEYVIFSINKTLTDISFSNTNYIWRICGTIVIFIDLHFRKIETKIVVMKEH